MEQTRVKYGNNKSYLDITYYVKYILYIGF